MSRSDVFLDLFSQIEKYLKSELSAGQGMTFYALVEAASRRFPAVARYSTDLKEFADLRNAIVHERTDSHVIAEPLEQTVKQFGNIVDVLLNPPRIDQFARRPVVTVKSSDSISKAISVMVQKSFSQLPIVENNTCTSVLTSNAIARWLGANRSIGLVSLDEALVSDVVRCAEPSETHKLVKRDASVFDVLQLFEDENRKGNTLTAVLVSQGGRTTESLLSIVTVSDLPAAYALISPRPRRTGNR